MHEKHDVLECRKLIIRDPAGGPKISIEAGQNNSGLWIDMGKGGPLAFLSCDSDGLTIGLHEHATSSNPCPSAIRFGVDGRLSAQSVDTETGMLHWLDLHTGGLRCQRPRSAAPATPETPAEQPELETLTSAPDCS